MTTPPNPNTDASKITYHVANVTDIPNFDAETMDEVSLWAVKTNGEKMRIRSMSLAHITKMRAANNIPVTVTDTDFLGQGVSSVLANLGFDHLELSVKKQMSPRSSKGQSVEFPPDAFEQGTTPGNIHPGE